MRLKARILDLVFVGGAGEGVNRKTNQLQILYFLVFEWMEMNGTFLFVFLSNSCKSVLAEDDH